MRRSERKNNSSYQDAKERVKKIKGFYVHLTVYLFVNIAIIFFNGSSSAFGNEGVTISSFYTAFFWGLGLFAHWASVFGQNLILGKDWEERKIKALMDKEKKEHTRWE